MIAWRPTKEQWTAALALAIALMTVRSRLSVPVSPAPLPRVAPREAPAAVEKDEIPVGRPRIVPAARATEGRDPLAASDIWTDPRPVPIPLPPELPERRIVPIVSLGEGRVRAPRPPRISSLPRRVAEAAPTPSDAPPTESGTVQPGGPLERERKP